MSETPMNKLQELCEKWDSGSREVVAELEALLPDVERLVEALSWALDLLDIYDEFLIRFGEPKEKVYSPIHLQGKEKARAALAALDQPVAPKETK